MRLPPLPKTLKYDHYLFIRLRRHESMLDFVEYRAVLNGMLIGVIYFSFGGNITYSAMGGPRTAIPQFKKAYIRWQKEKLFNKQMREIAR